MAAKIEDVLAKAQADLTTALDAAREELAEKEAELEPLRARVREAEQALARLTGQTMPMPTAARSRDLTDEEKARRAQKRRERRAAREAADDTPTE